LVDFWDGALLVSPTISMAGARDFRLPVPGIDDRRQAIRQHFIPVGLHPSPAFLPGRPIPEMAALSEANAHHSSAAS